MLTLSLLLSCLIAICVVTAPDAFCQTSESDSSPEGKGTQKNWYDGLRYEVKPRSNLPASTPIHEVLGDFPPPDMLTKKAIDEVDPDNSVEQQEWKFWKRRLSSDIHHRLGWFLRGKSIKKTLGEHLSCTVTYCVTQPGEIEKLQIIDKSSSTVFNDAVLTAVKSMKGSPSLKFPKGSKKQIQEMTSKISENRPGIDSIKPIEDEDTRKRLRNLAPKDHGWENPGNPCPDVNPLRVLTRACSAFKSRCG